MKRKERFLKIIFATARILFGLTFVFSGFVKAVDPIGFAYKIEDYLISFQLTQFIPLALTFAVALILLELLLGVFVLLGLYYRKATTVLAVLFMLVMTPMTLYIALKNPVEDCGCFGDALIIDNWSTFYKNIVLLFLALLLYVYRNKINPLFSKRTKNYVLAFVFLFSLLFCLYNILYLPVMDFRPYKVGVNIPQQMEDDLSKGDVYENVYIYEKDGIQKEFTEETFPWEDSTWTFVDLESKLIQEGEQPLIEDFSMLAYHKDPDGSLVTTDDITDEVLSKPINLLVVSLSLNDVNEAGMKRILALIDYTESHDIDITIITSSRASVVEQWSKKWESDAVTFASMDELTLKTIIRSNPGLILLNHGTIQAKWSKNSIPDETKLNKTITQFEVNEKDASHNNSTSKLFIICLLFASPLLGVKWYDRKLVNTYKIK